MLEEKIGKHEPIKQLTISYLQQFIDPSYRMSRKDRDDYENIVFIMLDAAYAEGVRRTLDVYQGVFFELLGGIPDSTKKVKEAVDILEKRREYNAIR